MERRSYTRAFADLTRTKWGMELNVVKLLKDLCEDYGLARTSLWVVTDDRQQALVAKELAGATIMLSPASGARALISSTVKDSKDPGPFLLVSYGRDVLEISREDSRLDPLSFGRYRGQRARSRELRVPSGAATTAVVARQELEPPVSSSAAAVPAESPDSTNPSEPEHRSHVFGKILVQKRLGPFADHRGIVYDAIEEIVQSDTKHCVSELLDLAVTRAKAESSSREQQDPSGRRLDPKLWAVIRRFIEQVVLDARVLVSGEGNPIGRDWVSRSELIVSLTLDWRAAVDGQLVLGLVAERDDITSLDGRNIARAIYHSSSQEAEQRVYDAVRYLLKARMIEESGPDHTLRRVSEPTHIRAVS